MNTHPRLCAGRGESSLSVSIAARNSSPLLRLVWIAVARSVLSAGLNPPPPNSHVLRGRVPAIPQEKKGTRRLIGTNGKQLLVGTRKVKVHGIN